MLTQGHYVPLQFAWPVSCWVSYGVVAFCMVHAVLESPTYLNILVLLNVPSFINTQSTCDGTVCTLLWHYWNLHVAGSLLTFLGRLNKNLNQLTNTSCGEGIAFAVANMTKNILC